MQAPTPVRVFVAEDDFLIADDLAHALEQAGAIVVGPVPTLDQGLRRLTRECGIEVAILDINLHGDLVFPLADILRRTSIPIVFFSGYDEISVPERFSGAIRISKVRSISEVITAAFDQWRRQADILPHDQMEGDTLVADLLPQLRLHGRQLTGDREKADDLVEKALESAIALVERGGSAEPISIKLHELLVQVYEQARKH